MKDIIIVIVVYLMLVAGILVFNYGASGRPKSPDMKDRRAKS